MKTKLSFLAACAATATCQPAIGNTIDCPLRDEPFSVKSPLIDVLLSPAARAVVDEAAPGKLDKLPQPFAGTTPPSFAAILMIEASGILTDIPMELDAGHRRKAAHPAGQRGGQGRAPQAHASCFHWTKAPILPMEAGTAICEWATIRLPRRTAIAGGACSMRAVQMLLGHTNIENTVRYLGVDIDDALTLSERTEIRTLAAPPDPIGEPANS